MATTRKARVAALIAAAATGGLLLTGAAGTASANPIPQSSSQGEAKLYRNSDFTNQVGSMHYGTNCINVWPGFADVASFENNPAPGCRLTLTARTPGGVWTTITLCEGQGVVPPDLRRQPIIEAKSGSAPACN